MDFAAPLEAGDMFVSATVLDVGARYPTGAGRVRHYDKNWGLKAEMATGRTGLISALCLDAHLSLHVLDPQAGRIDHFGANQMPHLPHYRFGSMIPKGDSTFILGEHLIGEVPGFEGKGRVCHVDDQGRLIREWIVQTGGGASGFLGVTHMALSPDGTTLFHVSETGPHLYAHDLRHDIQCGPLYTHDDMPRMVFGLACLARGDLLLAVGNGVVRLDPQGQIVCRYALPAGAFGHGWSVVIIRESGAQFWALDFFGGRVALVDVDTGGIAFMKDLELPKALAGFAEVPNDVLRGPVA
jgi:hypothetical protein